MQGWLPALWFLITLCWTSRVVGFPLGAGSCDGGKAAVGGIHLTQPQTIQATFADRGIQVSIGGNTVTPGQTLELIAGDSYEVEITASRNEFRGALVRLEAKQGQSVIGALTPGSNAGLAELCQAPVVGISHTDNYLKSTFVGMLLVEAVVETTLDITIVEINSAQSSIYMYGGYSINFTDAPGASAFVCPVPRLRSCLMPCILRFASSRTGACSNSKVGTSAYSCGTSGSPCTGSSASASTCVSSSSCSCPFIHFTRRRAACNQD